MRLARIVAPGLPHHVTQRGNRRQPTFFGEDDYRLYRSLLAEHATAAGVAVWAWCLMPNHVHLILVPQSATALTDCLRETHRRYTRHINQRERWRGYLWQGRSPPASSTRRIFLPPPATSSATRCARGFAPRPATGRSRARAAISTIARTG
jgi:REP element-mobilizing transposase RayT